MGNQSVTEVFQTVAFLDEIPQQHLEDLATIASIRDVDKQKILFRDGDVPLHVYLVVSGNVSLEMCAPGIGCKRILTIGPGEILAWSALLEQSRMTATARTIEPTQLVEIDAKLLISMFDRNPQLGYEFHRHTLVALAKRLSATRMQLLDIYGSNPPDATHASEEHDGR